MTTVLRLLALIARKALLVAAFNVLALVVAMQLSMWLDGDPSRMTKFFVAVLAGITISELVAEGGRRR